MGPLALAVHQLIQTYFADASGLPPLPYLEDIPQNVTLNLTDIQCDILCVSSRVPVLWQGADCDPTTTRDFLYVTLLSCSHYRVGMLKKKGESRYLVGKRRLSRIYEPGLVGDNVTGLQG